MKKLASALLATILGTYTPPALAWDGVQTGHISRIDVVASGNNFDVRVFLDNQPMCGASTADWGYLNISAGNYQASVAFLYSAWLAHRPVVLLMTATYNNTYCEIGYMETAG